MTEDDQARQERPRLRGNVSSGNGGDGFRFEGPGREDVELEDNEARDNRGHGFNYKGAHQTRRRLRSSRDASGCSRGGGLC